MSADNWAVCPRCRRKQSDEIRDRERVAAEAYGKVPADEWKKLDDAARLIPAPQYTLREDYEIGVHEDRLHISYSGTCQTCGLTVSFAHDQAADPAPINQQPEDV